MSNLYSNIVELFKRIIINTKDGGLFIFILLVLITIPFANILNSICIGILFTFSLVFFNKNNFNKNTSLFLPIVLYALMALSFFWSIDKSTSIKSLLKEISLLLIPLVFIFSKTIFKQEKDKIIKYFSCSIVVVSIYFIVRAFLNYFINDTNIFFGHELVTKELNAVHYSVFVSFSLLYFITHEANTLKTIIIQLFLVSFLFLLQSKTVIITTVFLISLYFFFYSKTANKMRLRNIVMLVIVFFSFLFFHRIKEKIEFEFQLNKDNNIGHTVIPKEIVGNRIISMKEAWENDKFEQSDFFSGASFRVYQFRMFLEIMKEENVFFQGLGLNASYKMLEEKGLKYNVFQGNETTEGYQKKNFHNQYIQVFSELGFIGFVFLILILFVNLKNALKNKDFTHIVFASLMISLFLTESFLWRQRGVVFFTVFYCLFNTIHLSEKENKIK
ncbi:O-antigen ligase family protein [Flavobacterium helocola]|uniref:O-antigen ligase family protein n=1 Tax=Flavobacterium helocola TaxID=3139139 RepID=A0ABU9I432_9FLAO